MMQTRLHTRLGDMQRFARVSALALVVGTISACEGLLDVEIPGDITESDLITNPDMAEIWLNSAMGRVECSFDSYLTFDDQADIWWRGIGYQGGMAEYRQRPGLTTTCGRSGTSYGWYVPMQVARAESEKVYEALLGYTEEQVPGREDMIATAATYAAFTYQLLGEVMCSLAVNLGPLMTPDEVQTEAEMWFTRALDQIAISGDFSARSTTSMSQMALVGRARARFAKNDFVGAAADASAIQGSTGPGDPGFISYITRDASENERRNTVFDASTGIQASVADPVFHVFGEPDAVQIPFTGYYNYQFTLDANNLRVYDLDANGLRIVYPLAISTIDGSTHDANRFPHFTHDANTVADPRVPVEMTTRSIPASPIPIVIQKKYLSRSHFIPFARWAEAQLILAEIEGGALAVARVNALRDVHGLPNYTVPSPSADDIRDLIIEERRREFFFEGRFYGTKIRKNLWFPRGVGRVPSGYRYGPGTCMDMPDNEFDLNPNLSN